MGKQDERFVKGHSFIMKDRPVKWAKVYEPDSPPWGGQNWNITVVLDDTWKKELEKIGMTPKLDKDGDWVIQVTRETKTAKGVTMSPPVIMGRDLKPTTELIGNGSICNIEVWARYATVKGTTYLKPRLNKLQVVELVKYEADGFEKLDSDVPF